MVRLYYELYGNNLLFQQSFLFQLQESNYIEPVTNESIVLGISQLQLTAANIIDDADLEYDEDFSSLVVDQGDFMFNDI
jgi:hypothetical protein